MKGVLKCGFSGIFGVILTLVVQFILGPQSFTFIIGQDEVIVTKAEYTELAEENNRLKDDLAEIQKLLQERNSEENIGTTIREATAYWDNFQYIQALTILKNCGITSAEIDALYQDYSDEFCTEILKQTDLLISERNYDEARKTLLEAKGLVANSMRLDNKLVDINNAIPIKLSALKISASRLFDLSQDKPAEDSVGNKYSAGNLYITRAEGDSRYGYATFYLGEKYTGMTGTIAVSDESENRSDVQLEGWIEIYVKNGDDYTQLYTSPLLSRTTSPINIPEINLSDSEWLEIRYYNNGDYFSLAGGYHSLRIILSNFMLYS